MILIVRTVSVLSLNFSTDNRNGNNRIVMKTTVALEPILEQNSYYLFLNPSLLFVPRAHTVRGNQKEAERTYVRNHNAILSIEIIEMISVNSIRWSFSV